MLNFRHLWKKFMGIHHQTCSNTTGGKVTTDKCVCVISPHYIRSLSGNPLRKTEIDFGIEAPAAPIA